MLTALYKEERTPSDRAYSPLDFSAAQLVLGQELPADVQEYFTLLNQDWQGVDLSLFLTVIQLPMALAWHQEMLADWDDRFTPTEQSVPEGAVDYAWFRRGWLPIAHDHSGTYLALDFAPGPLGQKGQVINIGGRETVKYVVFDSISDFCACLVANHRAGRLVVESVPRLCFVSIPELEGGHVMDFVASEGAAALWPS